ncbi:MAG: T9SS type A sorting domain-containing protein [Bacteroidia bacterium]|nr:T9SS type A sorting domain-containing protein [Bacteroidia bacterium]
MKYFFLLISLLLPALFVGAQTTYLKRLSFNTHDDVYYTHPEDSAFHLLDFSLSENGNSFILINTERGYNSVLKIDSVGNDINFGGSGWAQFGKSWINGLHATSDGGCVYASNRYSNSSSFTTSSTIMKFDSAGNMEWSVQIPYWHPYPNIDLQETFDIAILANGYAYLAEDSTYIYRHPGGPVRKLDFHGPGTIIGFPNGDMFLDAANFIGRIDSLGNTIYTVSGQILKHDTTLYVVAGDTIHLLNTMTGSFLSSVYFPATNRNILMLSDGGWLAYNTNSIDRFESNGNLKWSTTISLPEFGINRIGELEDGSLLTGGTYLSYDRYAAQNSFDYSSFISTIDTTGKSIMDSTTQAWIGDANDDGFYQFVDVVYVALALGSTGPMRYDTIGGIFNFTREGDIATDFANSFGIGVNHKQCDKYPDGIIDSLDIFYTALGGGYAGGIPTFWRQSQSQHNSSNNLIPFFSCLPDRDSAMTGDTVRFHFILGDNGVIIDSVFGLAFYLSFDSIQNSGMARVVNREIMNSDLGVISDQRSIWNAFSPNDIGIMTSRRDLQNSYFMQDTVALVDILITDSTSGYIDLTLSLLSFKAITAGGYPIEFQFNTSPVHLRTFNTSVDHTFQEKILLYPVPANEVLFVDNLPSRQLEISVYNYAGQNIMSMESNSSTRIEVDVKKFSSGIYFIQISDNGDLISGQIFVKE